jgi:hypothetical protein
MFSTTALLGAMLAMGPLVANAHMTMLNPVPWGKPNNSPLDAGGSDFPCKAVAYTGGKANDWPVGSTQQLSLGGTAVHGGGSCQISVSTDKAPTKSSKWKVIYSIEGGCPPPPPGGGNYVEGTQKSLVFPFTIPEELPNGDLAMSWTWFNKIGAREIYQNCAPVTVTGGASDMSAFDALPDMAVANIASINTCKTTETFDYTFENPGQYSIKNGTGPYKALCGGAPSSAGDTSGAPQQPSNQGVPSKAPVSPGSPSQVVGASTPSSPALSLPAGGSNTSTMRTIVTVTAPSGPAPSGSIPQGPASSSQAPAATLSAPAGFSLSPAASSPAPVASAPVSVSPSQAPAASLPAGSSCSPDGSVVCSADRKQFALCNFGKAVFQPVAQGTTCQGGKIARREYPTTLKIVYA